MSIDKNQMRKQLEWIKNKMTLHHNHINKVYLRYNQGYESRLQEMEVVFFLKKDEGGMGAEREEWKSEGSNFKNCL